jgi:AraC-like DNA-binding protein
MSVLSKFEKWAQKFKPYLIGYKNEFFVMHYMLNSPQEMIRRFRTMPFVKHNIPYQHITLKTPFVKLLTYYREVEDGAYVTYTEAEYKANVYFKCYADETKPMEYYTLSLRTNHSSRNIHSLANGISYADDSWIITKPGAKINLHHFRGTQGKYISFYFKQEWLDRFFEKKQSPYSDAFKAFVASEQGYFICAQNAGKSFDIRIICDFFKENKDGDSQSKRELYVELLNYVAFFEENMHDEGLTEKHFTISNSECLKVLHAKRILESKMYAKFPGISLLAKETGFSETKLKECFRLVYDKTLLQYFHGIQMEEAQRLILYTVLQITAIAKKFCYENPGKFAAAYKKYHVQLPSELKQELHRIISNEEYQHEAGAARKQNGWEGSIS